MDVHLHGDGCEQQQRAEELHSSDRRHAAICDHSDPSSQIVVCSGDPELVHLPLPQFSDACGQGAPCCKEHSWQYTVTP